MWNTFIPEDCFCFRQRVTRDQKSCFTSLMRHQKNQVQLKEVHLILLIHGSHICTSDYLLKLVYDPQIHCHGGSFADAGRVLKNLSHRIHTQPSHNQARWHSAFLLWLSCCKHIPLEESQIPDTLSGLVSSNDPLVWLP